MTEPLSPLPTMRELLPALFDGLLGDNPLYRLGKLMGQINAETGRRETQLHPDDVYAAVAEIRARCRG